MQTAALRGELAAVMAMGKQEREEQRRCGDLDDFEPVLWSGMCLVVAAAAAATDVPSVGDSESLNHPNLNSTWVDV